MDKNYIVNGILGGILPVIAISGAGATTIKTTNAVTAKIDGAIVAVAAATLAAIPATITVPANSTSSIGVYVNQAGTASYVQGTTVLNTSLVNVAVGANPAFTALNNTINLPQEVPGKALIGWVIVKTTTTVFTAGTTLLDAATYTLTYLDKPALSL